MQQKRNWIRYTGKYFFTAVYMCVSERTMPSTLLWAVDVYGRAYRLSTAGQQWEHCRDAHLEFKRVTAALQCCWSIACDHNIYLCVHGSEVPIRFREETYENQVTLSTRVSTMYIMCTESRLIWLMFVCGSDGTRWTVSQTACCLVIAGSGVM